jgi:hypothetical protein
MTAVKKKKEPSWELTPAGFFCANTLHGRYDLLVGGYTRKRIQCYCLRFSPKHVARYAQIWLIDDAAESYVTLEEAKQAALAHWLRLRRK